MMWTPPNRKQAISVPISFITRWIRLNVGFLSIISGRLPTTGHGCCPGGSAAGAVTDEHLPSFGLNL
jgi:hypothetical protein